MKKIFFLADYYYEEITGGAEICNDAIISFFKEKNITIIRKHCRDINISFLEENKDNLFIIANFFHLSNLCKDYISFNMKNKYVIIEHDHKYVSTNNPSSFVNFLVPDELIINKKFYKNAKAVFAQSRLHSEIIHKNLLLDNIYNLAGNCWTKLQIDILKKNMNSKKTIKYGILQTNNENKGMKYSIEYCKIHNLNYELIPLQEYEDFISSLSKVENLIFFPQWVETFSRVSVEAKILGCKIISNKLIGAASESFFKESPENIINYINKKSEEIPEDIFNAFNDKIKSEKIFVKLPKVSIITSLYKGEKFIEQFLEDITKQTIFSNSELIIIDANSPENEKDIIKRYTSEYNNIIYKRLDERKSVQETMNIAIKHSSGEYITIASVDDRKKEDALEIQLKNLMFRNDIDLVYFDCIVSSKENECFENCKSKILYEHSILNFSKENMIKCLPGPMPMWKKEMTNKVGNFNENLKFAGDWEFWLRCVESDYKFKKINKILGLYYFNPNGISTSKNSNKEKIEEESMIFNKYRNIIGEQNYNKYKGYFNGK